MKKKTEPRTRHYGTGDLLNDVEKGEFLAANMLNQVELLRKHVDFNARSVSSAMERMVLKAMKSLRLLLASRVTLVTPSQMPSGNFFIFIYSMIFVQ